MGVYWIVGLGLLMGIVSCATRMRDIYDLNKEVISDTQYDRQEVLRFIAYGDSRPQLRLKNRWNYYDAHRKWWFLFPVPVVDLLVHGIVFSLTQNPGYGEVERLMMRDAVWAHADTSRTKIDFVLHTGDIVFSGKIASNWDRFERENGDRIRNARSKSISFFTAIGNHEQTNNSTGWYNFKRVFGLDPDWPQFQSSFVIDSDSTAVFVLDSNVIMNSKTKAGAPLEEAYDQLITWLNEELEDRAGTNKIVSMHHPLVSFSKHHTDWTDNDREDRQRQLIELFKKHRISLLLSSHDHLFEYSQLYYDEAGQDYIMHFVTSGGGGVPLRKVVGRERLKEYTRDYQKLGYRVTLQQTKAIYHFCQVEILANITKVDVYQVAPDRSEPSLFTSIEVPQNRTIPGAD